MLIRAEEEDDHASVYAIHHAAFETAAEANLVNALRERARPLISIVAENEEQVIGHILFSPVTLSEHPRMKLAGLAPMAVLPEHQRLGIGSALVREGLNQCRQLGFEAVVVLGHPEYYPRFGFTPASNFGIDSDYGVPDNVFMVMAAGAAPARAVKMVPEKQLSNTDSTCLDRANRTSEPNSGPSTECPFAVVFCLRIEPTT